MNFSQQPKIELHCHLDGSVRPQTVLALANEQGLKLPAAQLDALTAMMQVPETCKDLVEYLKRFDLPLQVMQTQAGLSRVAYELAQDAAAEQVRYIEVRFAPLLHLEQGLTMQQAIAAVLEGLSQAERDFAIHTNVIICAMRNAPLETGFATLEAGKPFIGQGLVAFDLAGREDLGFAKDYIELCQQAKQAGYRLTVHAGETGYAQNVIDAIELLGAERIGHGVFAVDDEHALALLKKHKVAVEVCPTSNLHTKAFPSLSAHPVASFVRQGLEVNVSTDNRTVSNTNMSNELTQIDTTFNLSEQEYSAIYRASVTASFASQAVKDELLALHP